MVQVFLSLGSNKGNRLDFMMQALGLINDYAGQVVQTSDIFESTSWGYQDADYLNAVAEIETDLSPEALLNRTQIIEKKSGRNTKTVFKEGKPIYSARTVDIDILFYDKAIIRFPQLTVPHPLLHLRRFVLQPLLQIAPDFRHPRLNKSIRELYQECEDTGKLRFFKKIQREDFL